MIRMVYCGAIFTEYSSLSGDTAQENTNYISYQYSHNDQAKENKPKQYPGYSKGVKIKIISSRISK